MAYSSPLSSFLDSDSSEYVGPAPKRKYKKKSLFIGLFLLFPTLNSTFASQITIGSGGIEFGQGSQTTSVCDTNITVNLQSTYDAASQVFEVSTVTLGDLDTRVGQCAGRVLTIKALNSSGTELDLNGNGSGNALSYTVSGTSGQTETRTITLDASASVDSTAVARVLVETSA